jgi:hypothetical protein
VNRSLDFSNRAHAGKLSAMRFGVNAAKLSAYCSGVSADRRNFQENSRVWLSAEEPLRRVRGILAK